MQCGGEGGGGGGDEDVLVASFGLKTRIMNPSLPSRFRNHE